MERRYQAQLLMLQTAQVFLAKNDTALGPISSSPAIATLNDAVAAVERYAAEQIAAGTARSSHAVVLQHLRTELRIHHMQPIARVAQTQLANVKEISKLKLPRMRTDDNELVAAGRGMATAVKKYKNVFIEQQFPATFIDDLRAAVNAVRAMRSTGQGNRVERKAATEGILFQLTRAKGALRVLDSLVVKQLAGQNAALAAWTQALRLHAKSGPKTGSAATTTEASTKAPTEAPEESKAS